MSKHIHKITAMVASSLLMSFAAQAYQDKGFLITGGATYLEPAQNDLDYVEIVNSAGAGNIITSHHISPGYNWGYFIGLGYTISKDYDVQLDWSQFDSDQTQNSSPTGFAGGVVGYLTSNNVLIPLAAGQSISAHTREELNAQTLDANIGQYHELSEAMNVRLSTGIRYAKVNSRNTNTYGDPAFSSAPMDKYSSKYNGIGPEAGLDLEYKVADSSYGTVGVVGKLLAAFLIGEQESNSNVFFTSISGNQHAVHSESNVRMIPTLNAKLGLNWGLIEGGYQVAYYFNVVDQLQYISGASEVTHNYSSVGVMGPYLNFSATF